MKQLLSFSFLLTVLIHSSAHAQVNERISSGAHLKTYDLEITHNKTTSLIFPEDVISADVGSIGVIADKFEKASNIIKVKANRRNFEETSLTVVTGEGRVWTYVVRYTANPRYLSVDMYNADALLSPSLSQAQSSLLPLPIARDEPRDTSAYTATIARIEGARISPAQVKHLIKQSTASSRHVRNLGQTQHRIDFVVRNIFVKKLIMFIQFGLKNRSQIDYEIGVLNLIVKDAQRGKRTSVQEIKHPVLKSDLRDDMIKGKSEVIFTYAIPKLTIPDSKVLNVQLYEQSGGRHLEFSLTNKAINKARELE